MEILKCTVLGTGAMGIKYAAMIYGGKVKNLKLTAVCARSDESAARAKEVIGQDVKICRSEDELYENSSLFDAVIIVTPHKLHPGMSVRALEAGKHVMCDKPAAVTAGDAEEVNKVAARTKKVYAMMCHQRAYPHFIKIRELLDGGAVGKIRRILFENTGYFRTEFYHRSAGWRSSWKGEGGGALINQGYHLINMWNYLFGLPEAVYADIPFGKYNNFKVDDEATVLMDYRGGATGTFILTTGEGAAEERLEVAGDRGRILFDGKKITLTRFCENLRDYAKTAQVTSLQQLEMSEEVFGCAQTDGAYITMLENFAGAVLHGKELIAPACESAQALQIINAAYLSAWRQKKVALPLDNLKYSAELKKRESEE